MSDKPTGLALLREPFADNHISKMCRSTKKDNQKSKCGKCGGFHGQPSVQLSYVGHAALTDRLLDADPNWTWKPLAIGPDGTPVVDRDGGMWIELTVCGVTRLGYGDNQNREGGDGVKERIGDALRNAAMRFGAALDLWHKGDLHADDDEPKPANGKTNGHAQEPPKRTWQQAVAEITDHATAQVLAEKLHKHYSADYETHDACMRQLAAKCVMLAAEGKMEQHECDSICTVLKGWIKEPTPIEDTERQFATRY